MITILSSSSEFITFEIYLTDCVVNVTSVTWVTSLSRYVTLQDDNEEDVQTMTTVLGCHTITIHEASVSPTIGARDRIGPGNNDANIR